ncbi:MAG: hypothetical protein R2747_15095 [Pyrinomonadaceae bacterium]
MKLRIRGNSIRLRLTQSEIENFGRTGLIEETVEFGPLPRQRLVYALASSDRAGEVFGRYDGGKITIVVPQATAENWASTDEVGITGEQDLGESGILRILIEKDFACLTERPFEDESDNFPNPKAEC